MNRRTSNCEAGFALIESIAVLALSGLVMLTLVIATDLVSRNSEAAARSANTIETLATGFAALRRDLESAHFMRVGANAEDPVLFAGTAQSVALVAGDVSNPGAGESLVLIEARYEDGRGVLLRSSARLVPGMTGFGAAEFANPAVLLSGPWRYRLSYSDSDAATESWKSAWAAANHLPTGIRLEVLNDAGQNVMSPLLVHLRVNSGGCAEPAHTDCAAANSGEEGNQNQDQNGTQDKNNSGNGDANGG